MKFLLPRVTLTTLALGACAIGYAQDPVPIEFYRPLKNSVSVGVRVMGGNTKVNFSHIGNIRAGYATLPSNAGFKFYDNGYIIEDAQRTVEVDNTPTANPTGYETVSTYSADGKTTTVTTRREDYAPGRYRLVNTTVVTNDSDSSQVSSVRQVMGDYIKHELDYTRNWSYNHPDQIRTVGSDQFVDMSIYNITPGSDTAQAESDSSPGVELQFARVIKRYKRFEWGLNFSVGGSDINAKTTKTIRGTLHAATDSYKLKAGSSSLPSYWPYNSVNDVDVRTDIATVVSGVDADGNALTSTNPEYAYEQSRILSFLADGTRTYSSQDVQVTGNWQIKGAYYMMRAGPVARFPLSPKWTVSVGAGFAGAYVGSRFVADEYTQLEDVPGLFRTTEQSDKKAFVSGLYGDVNLERWLTVRTGLFAGFSYEKLGKYTHELGGRKAEVDLGGGTGYRFGIITRF